MLSGREEPEQTDLQMVPMLRPLSLRDHPALGAAGTKGSTDAWSEIATASDPEIEDALGALPSSAQAKQKKMKKRVVIQGNAPHSEAACQYTHPAYMPFSAREVD